MPTSTELIPTSGPFPEPPRGSSREKWLALIALVMVSVAAVALLHPR
ncbi:MAG: hypothetical protein ACLPWF_14855 [Bryobacteraceae bacterium]